MKIVMTAAAAVVAIVLSEGTTSAAVSAQAALSRYKAAWNNLQTYTCTYAAHEESGSRSQDQIYNSWFSKPHDARLEIVSGAGRGGVAVWRGGDAVRAHRGGLMAFVKLRLNIHDPRVTSLRGTTIADANFGALYKHLAGLKTKSLAVMDSGGRTTITAILADPAADHYVTREVVVLGGNDLPVAYGQWEGNRQVKRVIYSNVRVNAAIPPSTFNM
jgi:outer membrane lipoprotein-sorting protein